MCFLCLLAAVPVWSSMTACGVRLRDLNPKAGMKDDPENWGELHTQVVNGCVVSMEESIRSIVGLCV